MLTIMLQTCDTQDEADQLAQALSADQFTTVTSASVVGADGVRMVCAIYDDESEAMNSAAMEMIRKSLGLEPSGILQ